MATVKHEGGVVRLEGAKGFHPGEFASSVHGAQARILEALGEPLSYDDLVCYGAFAFRLGVHVAMCPSAAHPCCGFMCVEGSNRAIPWRMTMFDQFPGSKPRPDRAAFEAEVSAAIKSSIDRGIPVHYGSEEDGLIVGYGDEGRRWLCLHPYFGDGKTFWHHEARGFGGGKWPWGVVVWTERKPASELADDRDLTLFGLRQAVEMWHAEKRGDYFVGEAAYARWLEWLKGVQSGEVKDPQAGMPGNGWCYDVLVQSRRIAGRWLNQKAGSFEGEAAKQLREAAGEYSGLVDTCMKGLESPWDLTVEPGRFDGWTADMRRDEIARLEAAREHDRAALSAIEKALAAAK